MLRGDKEEGSNALLDNLNSKSSDAPWVLLSRSQPHCLKRSATDMSLIEESIDLMTENSVISLLELYKSDDIWSVLIKYCPRLIIDWLLFSIFAKVGSAVLSIDMDMLSISLEGVCSARP